MLATRQYLGACKIALVNNSFAIVIYCKPQCLLAKSIIIAVDRYLPLTYTKLIEVDWPAPPHGPFRIKTVLCGSVRVTSTG